MHIYIYMYVYIYAQNSANSWPSLIINLSRRWQTCVHYQLSGRRIEGFKCPLNKFRISNSSYYIAQNAATHSGLLHVLPTRKDIRRWDIKKRASLLSSWIVVVSYYWMFSIWCWYASLIIFWVRGIWGYCLSFIQCLSSVVIMTEVVFKMHMRCVNLNLLIQFFETPHASRWDSGRNLFTRAPYDFLPFTPTSSISS